MKTTRDTDNVELLQVVYTFGIVNVNSYYYSVMIELIPFKLKRLNINLDS